MDSRGSSASGPAFPRRPGLLSLGVRACSSSASGPVLPRRPGLLFLGVRACSSSASGPALPRRPDLLSLGVRACSSSASGAAFSRSSGLLFLRNSALLFFVFRLCLSGSCAASCPGRIFFRSFCFAPHMSYLCTIFPPEKSAPLNKRSFRCV